MDKILQTLLTQEISFTTAEGQSFEASPDGSLGLLTLGYQGLAAWRQAREKKLSCSNMSLKAEAG